MLWACILLPQLALDAIRRGMRPPDLQPARKVEERRPDLPMTRHDPRQEERLRHLLAAWAYRYSSMVSLEGEDALVLEVQGSLGLFGPWPRLERMLRDDLQALGFQHRIALAITD
ncbi:MAG: DNA polymerase Y family protein, partial [Arenimonas sp.]